MAIDDPEHGQAHDEENGSCKSPRIRSKSDSVDDLGEIDLS
jgi:hypothetical protein